jgi:hypothetical protein
VLMPSSMVLIYPPLPKRFHMETGKYLYFFVIIIEIKSWTTLN